ncbi:RNA polymerase Rpb4-domain-containing protein [Truncatella angustata]|uniref:DNA-directed RNA polymerase III subunit RPC9 n=1 Tax=Truncatella angustata TaxID=152316 RepID=A0A9P9A029_9PEZI|nr:RNA polymerase Rpb4-domain-containing protein [Truncatella angustata]KAH6656838.1 RNA polymerase Rpb4-domain-containing protein [Truncatella angustata]
MKVLEAQSAVLTNVEVYQFLQNQAKQYQEQKRRGPGNLETLRRELLQYFETHPGPLSQKPSTYDEQSITKLLEKLRPYDITKGEMIMILNVRPTNPVALNTVIEDMEVRFGETEQENISAGIAEVLGQFPEDEAAEEDVMETTEDQ